MLHPALTPPQPSTPHLDRPIVLQPAPGWVNSLPEPERTEKLNDIKKYGSPNVFGQFAPHVTLAWDEDATKVAAAIAATSIPYVIMTADLKLPPSVACEGPATSPPPAPRPRRHQPPPRSSSLCPVDAIPTRASPRCFSLDSTAEAP